MIASPAYDHLVAANVLHRISGTTVYAQLRRYLMNR
ncbi:hypothetical protein SLEP1_g41355 [Rubroshorea leprosula]|uniref:Uncharacterized protein n=1 Tax=Rubroshorea leprosula TaxID=152421 RepID=A0AAV5L6T5_9ROSI|nr:hypothetical protein SLEP1_g41355 [Rubroshorea leprosula]